MIVAAQPKQFTLKDDGYIYFQPDSTNPLPGDVLAVLRKGESLLQPRVELTPARDLGSESVADVLMAVETWVKAHIYTVLEPLFSLVGDETLSEPNREIAFKLFEHTGIVPRGDVEASIAKLDPEMRKVLRDKKVRLGPVLVFLPELNKPVAVKLRAILWSLFHEKPLPAPTPRDGAMSAVVDVTTADPDFYRAIGYPLYGPRVIRIDMLDRVINAIYDTAKEGKFRAEHKMAEWMGCPIADLYAILESMGHRRIQKPIDPVVPSVVAEEPVVLTNSIPSGQDGEVESEKKDDATIPVDSESKAESEGMTPDVPETKKQEQKKPELDLFLLRRGKAHVDRAERPFRPNRTARSEVDSQSDSRSDSQGEMEPVNKKVYSKADKKPFPPERYAPKGQKTDQKFNKKRTQSDEKLGKKGSRPSKGDDASDRHNPRIYTAEASESDNPFAILQNLKLK
ncbi:MAG: hypothetical protein JNL76_06045 [Alphaproteobacteria bacterium]|nr:hypothetical protein [Alphaproteobacteria bacterium]